MNDLILLTFLFAPLVLIILMEARDLRRWWRLEIDQYHKWWPWIRFTEPELGQQNHLAQGQNHKARWCVFRLEEKQLCRFRLPFGLSALGTIGQITWDGHEVHVEGRISRLTLVSPFILAAWMAVVMGTIYLRSTPDFRLWSLFAIIGGVAVGMCILFAGIYLLHGVFERVYFRRAYREIKLRIWQTKQG
ncbi:MAG: hypothetical protein WAW03_00490 [Anaerolineae bacterium]|uniref:hypothetical protein n=1 Tax=Candidatus Amarolinea dominans TaxID=3140696 RepID=UPI001D58D1B0|nr:hypothetical protein [Anaerolineae bacterium]MBK7199583.1 hypothetical protein [Anaerolineae bacterium]MBK9232055.1 hypothetical protein [Anaerolineae bacterium]